MEYSLPLFLHCFNTHLEEILGEPVIHCTMCKAYLDDNSSHNNFCFTEAIETASRTWYLRLSVGLDNYNAHWNVPSSWYLYSDIILKRGYKVEMRQRSLSGKQYTSSYACFFRDGRQFADIDDMLNTIDMVVNDLVLDFKDAIKKGEIDL